MVNTLPDRPGLSGGGPAGISVFVQIFGSSLNIVTQRRSLFMNYLNISRDDIPTLIALLAM